MFHSVICTTYKIKRFLRPLYEEIITQENKNLARVAAGSDSMWTLAPRGKI